MTSLTPSSETVKTVPSNHIGSLPHGTRLRLLSKPKFAHGFVTRTDVNVAGRLVPLSELEAEFDIIEIWRPNG